MILQSFLNENKLKVEICLLYLDHLRLFLEDAKSVDSSEQRSRVKTIDTISRNSVKKVLVINRCLRNPKQNCEFLAQPKSDNHQGKVVVAHILRENNFWDSGSAKFAILTTQLEALEFNELLHFLLNYQSLSHFDKILLTTG